MIGNTISQYRITEKLGGGIGEGCRAEDTTLCRHVAIRILADHFGQMLPALLPSASASFMRAATSAWMISACRGVKSRLPIAAF
jgi:hypothetical protein